MGLGGVKPRLGFIVRKPDQRLTDEHLIVDLDQHLRDHAHDGHRDLDRSRGGLDPSGGHRLPAFVVGGPSSRCASGVLLARSRSQHRQREHNDDCAEGG